MPSPTPSPPPTSINPYEVLGLPSTSTATEIRTTYRRLALRVHPDKVPPESREAAHKSFQELAFAYAILSDEKRRKRYDDTGSTSEGLDGGDELFDWFSFWKEQVKELVSPEAVERFRLEYQGSKEERTAVLEAYVDAKGSMDVIFERVMVSRVLDDEERFVKVIQEAIEAGEVEAFKSFTHESKASKKRRRKQAEGEKREAEEYAKEIGVYDQLFGKKNDKDEHEEEEEEYEKQNEKGKRGKRGLKTARRKVKQDDTSALETLIKNRSMDRVADFMANLEAKYVTGVDETRTKSKGGRKHRGEPTEEEFQAARQRMASNSREKTTEDVNPQRRSKRVRR